MSADIASKEDIILLVNSFYDRIKGDDTIGYIFNQIIGHDWSHHLPVMYQFWETILFNKAGYTGNPVKKHLEIDKQIPLQQAHFDRWLFLWDQTIDELFTGNIADEARKRASLMMGLISMKIAWAREGKAIQ